MTACLFGTYVRAHSANRLLHAALAAPDRAALLAADLVLADTAAHAAYLGRVGVRTDRTAVWHLGAELEFFAPRAAEPAGRRVLFYGRYLPLHGIETIIAAAAR